ncbi:hypothetical protein PSU4_39680 [Pseudonocardia sulfidoxydans NBRC 16205]|uniref:HTH marR-type domain-containing protein n=1 Tax=Pseudonocardia sulfidoxydans NBRC 16205 TaxID=1223511 RepID=A0A511DMI9_9PSEU|nr:MarR family transcriptional regulator [Pseudonocardia sulfidoxydans]GEL25014.1 hypothetical protein PSU4_39680 [Pseudonocardia sulfidoxydans NBRC 16205]
MLSLIRVLGSLERQLTQHLESVLATEGLNIDQWRVLELLADGVGLPMSRIAHHLLVPGATLTKIVDRLTDASLVYRRVDQADRRRVLVLLGDRGQLVYHRLSPMARRVEREFLVEIGVDPKMMYQILGQVAKARLLQPRA